MVDSIVNAFEEYWHHKDSADIIALDSLMQQYMNKPEEYRRQNADTLCRRMLKVLNSGEAVAPYYFLSAILNMTGNVDVFEILVVLCTEDKCLSKEEKHFVFYQLMHYRFIHPEVNEIHIRDLLDDLYQEIYSGYYKDVEDLADRIPKENRKKDFVVILATQVLNLSHGPTKTLLDRCYILHKRLNKQVYIINTAEALTSYGMIPWFYQRRANYNLQYGSQDFIEYRGCKFPFLQCPQEMPQIPIIRSIMQMVSEERPYYIVSIGESITADMCSLIVPTITVTLGPSERAECRTTFQMTGHRIDDDDRKWLKKVGYTEEHIIQGLFTSAFKEQTHTYSRHDLNLPEDGKICLVVGGRLDGEVIDDFIAVVLALAEKGIYTAFMGGLSRYKQICAGNELFSKYTINLGFQDDALAVYECCDIYLNPTRLGGGTSAAEALYKGIPVITLDYGDVAIGVGKDFCVKNYSDMIDMAERLAKDDAFYARMSDKARRRAKKLMDSEGEFVRIINEMESKKLFF